MITFKNKLKSNYTQVPNQIIYNSGLSWKAKGIFSYLCSRPSDWEFYMTEIVKNASDGETALKSGIKELEEAGWLTRRRKHGDDGSFSGMEWIISFPDHKQGNPSAGNHHQWENPTDGKSTTTNTDNTNTDNNTNTYNVDYQFWVDKWNEINEAQCRVTDKKRKHIRQRLDTWSKDELIEAMENRANDEWINNEGSKYKTKFISFWRNDEKVEEWLHRDNSHQEKQTSMYSAFS